MSLLDEFIGDCKTQPNILVLLKWRGKFGFFITDSRIDDHFDNDDIFDQTFFDGFFDFVRDYANIGDKAIYAFFLLTDGTRYPYMCSEVENKLVLAVSCSKYPETCIMQNYYNSNSVTIDYNKDSQNPYKIIYS